MSSPVLDASAVLVALSGEPGADVVARQLALSPSISAVNLAEVVAKLTDCGADEAAIRQSLNTLDLEVVEFDARQAYDAGLLRSSTRTAGLSLGDRACIALARSRGAEAFTADRSWTTVDVGVTVTIVR